MSIACLTEFAPAGTRTTTNYDAITHRLDVHGDPPQGMLLHCAGYTEDGTFRLFDVWATDEDERRFAEERLLPAIRAVAGDTPGPERVERYELHHCVAPEAD